MARGKNSNDKSSLERILEGMQRESLSQNEIYELSRRLLEESEKQLELARKQSLEIEKLFQEDKRLKEFAKQRWYESNWDYYYRMRNVPKKYLSFHTMVWMHRYDKDLEDLLRMIQYERKKQIKQIASSVIQLYSKQEIIDAEDIEFSVRFTKKQWRKSKRVYFDWDHWNKLFPLCDN